jgi:hypothetical protein
MASCERYFQDLVNRVEPSESQKDGARRSHLHLRSELDSGKMANRIVESYLSGSYARDTAIAPLDDVDVIFLIDPRYWQSELASVLGIKPSPQQVLDTFANAIRYRYPNSSIFFQRRSIRLDLSHLSIDAVPALDAGGGKILIGDADKDEWIVSAPKIHESNSSYVNKARKGLFKPLVKVLKFWNAQLPSTAQFKSFAIETIAVRLFNSVDFDSLQKGFLLFLDFLAHVGGESTSYSWNSKFEISLDWWSHVIPDAAGTGSNLGAGVSDDRRKRFMENAIVSRNRMIEAQNANSEYTAENRTRQAMRD